MTRSALDAFMCFVIGVALTAALAVALRPSAPPPPRYVRVSVTWSAYWNFRGLTLGKLYATRRECERHVEPVHLETVGNQTVRKAEYCGEL